MRAWSLVTCRLVGHSEPVVAALTSDGQVWEVPALRGHHDLVKVLDSWDAFADELRAWEVTDGLLLDGAEVLAPLRYPRKLICAGANYTDHLREMGITEIPPDMEPYFFLLPPTTIVGPGDAVAIPADPQARVDWEAELAVVIGRPGRHITPDAALNHVAGYSILNDISARGWHARQHPLAPPFAYDWLGSKGLDTFSPMGPGVTPAWFVPDPQDLRIRLWRNGVVKQNGSTSEMIFSIAQLITGRQRPHDPATGGRHRHRNPRRGRPRPAGITCCGRRPHHRDRHLDTLGRLQNPVTIAAPATTPIPGPAR